MNKKKKKSIVKILSFLMAVFLSVSVFVSCDNQNDNPIDTTDSEMTEKDESNDPIVNLIADHLNEYQVVRSDTMNSDEVKIILAFLEVVRKNGGDKVKMVTDYTGNAPVIDREIVIGNTEREGSVYSIDDISLEKGEYDVQIVDSRLIFRYADKGAMMEGLEYLLITLLSSDDIALKNEYAEQLFDRGIGRYEFTTFSIFNRFMDKMHLPAKNDTLCDGTAEPNSKITVELSKNDNVLKSSDAVTAENGKWKLAISPALQADQLAVKVDGVVVAKYKNISFVDSIMKAPSNGMKVYIDGVQADVFESEAGYQVMASLKNNGQKSMTVKIERASKIYDCTVRPLSSGLEPTVSGKTVTFTVTTFPCKLSVEFDDFNEDPTDSVQLYLYDYEAFDPMSVEGELHYYAPGEYWVEEMIQLKSNTTVYVAEGAVLHARFTATDAENFTVMGRGIIDTFYFAVEQRMMEFKKCSNIVLKDYLLTGPRRWMTVFTECDQCLVDGVSIVGTRVNSDGVDIVGSQNVTVQNCFIRSNDDCIAVKAMGTDVKNIKVINTVFWNDQYGNALEIGYETRADSISEIVFENNDIIHVVDGACFSIHLGDRASVSDVIYRDIRIEDARGKLIEFFIKETQYTKDKERGQICDILFENIEILGDVLGRIIFTGYDDAHLIRNVTIKNLKFNNRVMNASLLNTQINEYAQNIVCNGIKISKD